jgi:hypothetical protein
MCHNRTNDLEVMTSENFWWLLEIPVRAEWNNFSTSGFGPNQSKICGNSECRSRRKFHKLSTEGGNSELHYRAKEAGMVEVDNIF